jgi:hypothetical protein
MNEALPAALVVLIIPNRDDQRARESRQRCLSQDTKEVCTECPINQRGGEQQAGRCHTRQLAGGQEYAAPVFHRKRGNRAERPAGPFPDATQRDTPTGTTFVEPYGFTCNCSKRRTSRVGLDQWGNSCREVAVGQMLLLSPRDGIAVSEAQRRPRPKPGGVSFRARGIGRWPPIGPATRTPTCHNIDRWQMSPEPSKKFSPRLMS